MSGAAGAKKISRKPLEKGRKNYSNEKWMKLFEFYAEFVITF
jgi:hypothetical protein